MKIIIQCECGNKVELKPYQLGQQVYMSNIEKNNFTLGNPVIKINEDLDEIKELEDIDDVNCKLESVEIRCRNCGKYISLEDWND